MSGLTNFIIFRASQPEFSDAVPLAEAEMTLHLAITAVEELPKMIERGRDVLGVSVKAARVIGRVAVNQGKVEFSRIASQWNDLGSVMRSGAMQGRPARSRTTAEEPAPLHDATSAPRAVSAPAPRTVKVPASGSNRTQQAASRMRDPKG